MASHNESSRLKQSKVDIKNKIETKLREMHKCRTIY